MSSNGLRLYFIQGVRLAHGGLPPEDVIETKTELALKAENPVSYAFMCGRNWAIDQERRRVWAIKRAEEEAKRASDAAREDFFRRTATQELKELLVKLASENVDKPTILKWLGCVRLAYIEEVPPREWGERFGNPSSDCLYQWKRRGVKLVLKHAKTKELRQYLDKYRCCLSL